MFKFIFISVLCVSLARMSNHTIVKFGKFMEKYHKSYDTFEEYGHRLKIFSNNMDLVKTLNAQHVRISGQDVHVFGVTKFSDLTDEEFAKSHLGYNPSEFNSSKVIFFKMNPLEKLSPMLEMIGRHYWPQTAIKNQGICGNCWAMCVTEEIESFTKIKYPLWNLQPLSVQQITDCDNRCNGCKGCYSSYAYDYVSRFGIESEASYPFSSDGNQQVCNYRESRVVVSISGYYYLENDLFEKNYYLRFILNYYGPFNAGVPATSWQHYIGGVFYNSNMREPINHCVQFVGVDMTISFINYWIARNSWGSDWGEDGYIRIATTPPSESKIVFVQFPNPETIHLV